MTGGKDDFKEQLLKKTITDIDFLIIGQKQKIAKERDLMTLNRLNSDLRTMQDVRDQKLRESGRPITKAAKPTDKPDLKSYEDYVKSKK